MHRQPFSITVDDLQYEESICWLEDISGLRYVREIVFIAARWRRKPLRCAAGRVVGYSVLRSDAPNNGLPGTFTRRIFWLATHDPYDAVAPYEAVAPASVVPGRRGVPPWRFYEEITEPDIGPFKAFLESLQEV